MANTQEISLGTESAKRSLQELQAVADQLDAKLKSIAGVLGGGNASQQDSANFFSTASQLSSVRSQMANQISGSATSGGGASPFGGGDAFAAPGFKMQKLGDVAQAAAFVMANTSGNAREALMQQVLSGAVPMMNNSGGSGGGRHMPPPNQFNPFAGNEPTGLSMPLLPNGVQRLQYDYENQQRYLQQRNTFIGAAGYAAAHFAGEAMGAYTQAITSGQPQPMAFGAAYGGAGGFAIGAGIGAIAGSFIPGAGTFIGAGVGGLIGSTVGSPLINAIQAPYVREMQVAQNLIPTALQSGLDPATMAKEAVAVSNEANESYINKTQGFSWNRFAGGFTKGSFFNPLVGIVSGSLDGFFPHGGLSSERLARQMGIHAGIDQASPADVAEATASLSTGYLGAGIDPARRNIGGAGGEVDAILRNNPALGSAGAKAIAAAQGRVLGATPETGGNLTELLLKVGLPTLLTANQNMDAGTRQALITAGAAIPGAARLSRFAVAEADEAGANYDSSAFSGASTRGRSAGFNSLMDAMRGQSMAIGNELSAVEASPGGANTPEAAAIRARKAMIDAKIAAEYSKRAQGIVSDIQAGAGVGIAGANADMSRANLYGSPEQFAAPTAALRSALSSEASGLQSALSEKGLSYQDSMHIRTRITEIGQQIAALPATQAAQEFGRRNILADARAAESGVVSTRANLYGDNGAVEAAGGGMIAAQRQIMSDAFITMNNPNASIETRSAAEMRAAGAQNAILQTQAGTRQTVINRIQASAGAEQAELGVKFARAAYGSGADMRAAGAGLTAAFGAEAAKLTEQINAPGTTVEQKLALRSQIAGLQTSAVNLTEQARDAGFEKDFISGYGLEATKLSGQAARQELLPFNPGNRMRTSLQIVQNNQKGLGLLAAREAELKAAGTLSPERQLEIETQRQNLLTQDDAQIANLANDLPNRLPGMSAGRPAFAARLNSFDLAAMAVRGTGIRSFGAHGGGQLREQDDFLHDLTTPGAIRARSTTQGINNGGDSAVVAAIEKLITVVQSQSGGGSGIRPGEGVGAIASAVYGKRAGLDNGRQ